VPRVLGRCLLAQRAAARQAVEPREVFAGNPACRPDFDQGAGAGRTCRLPDSTRRFAWTIGGGHSHTRAAFVSTAAVGGALEQAAGVLLRLVLVLWVLAPRVPVPRVPVPRVLTRWLRRREVVPGGQSLVAQVSEEPTAAGDRAKDQVAQPVRSRAGSLK